jgi:ribonuclease R
MVRLRSMDDDFYVFDEKNYSVRGKKYGKTYRLGDKVKILVKAADVEKRQIDFEMI